MMNVETVDFLSLIKKKTGIIILFGLIFALFSFYAFVFTQKRYETKTDFLIIQDQVGSQDFYSLSKSAEYIGGILSEAIYSSVFIEEVKNTNKVDASYFPVDGRDMMKAWKKAVKIENSPNLGILKIDVYDNDKNTAIGISQAISEIMVNKNYLFRGKVDLEVRVLSGPITEKNPSVGKILLVIVGGFIVGALIELMHVYYVFIGIMIRKAEREEYLNSLKNIR
jgi:capsular polysaccharide biosynthesis protein